MIKPLFLFVCALTCLLGPAQAAVIANNSFEDPTAPTGSFLNFDTANQGLPGWTVTTNNVDVVSGANPNPPAAAGVQYLDLVGTGGTGGIAQTFTTVANQQYSISFAYANNPNFAAAAASVSVGSGINDGSLFSGNFVHSTTTPDNADWLTFTGLFTANSAQTTLSFLETVGGGNGGIFLDDILVTEVSAVPLHPSTWANVLLALAAFGFMAHRQQSKPALLAA